MSRTGWNRRVAGWPARLALPLGAGDRGGPRLVAFDGPRPGAARARARAPVAGRRPPRSGSRSGAPVIAPSPPFAELPHDVQVVRFQGPDGDEGRGSRPRARAGLARRRPGPGHVRPEGRPVVQAPGLRPARPARGRDLPGRRHGRPHAPARPGSTRPSTRSGSSSGPTTSTTSPAGACWSRRSSTSKTPTRRSRSSWPRTTRPFVTLSPAEEPFKVARALGRVMAIVRIGGRQPTPEEVNGPAGLGLANTPARSRTPPAKALASSLAARPAARPRPPAAPGCLATSSSATAATEASRSTSPATAGSPGSTPATPSSRFNADDRPRVLPTNVVCVYAPRFASVRAAVGATEALNAAHVTSAELLQRMELAANRQGTYEARPRARSPARTGSGSRPPGSRPASIAGEHTEVRILGGFDSRLNVASHQLIQGVDRKTAIVRPPSLPRPGSSSTGSSRPRARWRPASSRGPARPS